MPDLKQDLLKDITDNKIYDELELARLASEPNMNYREKINSMSNLLERIALHDAKAVLVHQYFKPPTPEATQPQAPQPQGQSHSGQSHGE